MLGLHRHFLASISPGGWRVWLHLLYEPRNLGLYQEETYLFTFSLIFMNLKYLVVFFFPELLNEQSSKTQSQNFSGGNLLKDM